MCVTTMVHDNKHDLPISEPPSVVREPGSREISSWIHSEIFLVLEMLLIYSKKNILKSNRLI